MLRYVEIVVSADWEKGTRELQELLEGAKDANEE